MKTLTIQSILIGLLTLALFSSVSSAQLVSNERAIIRQAQQLEADYLASRLSQADAKTYERLIANLDQSQHEGPSSYIGVGVSKSCQCTAFCQTIVFINGTEYQWTGTGTVSSPSACADAAEKYCGGAYSTWLDHWTCK